MSQFDWPALMRAGIRGLGLKPAEFWALSPAELSLMLGQGSAAPAMSRDRLQHLLRLHPDDTSPEHTKKDEHYGTE